MLLTKSVDVDHPQGKGQLVQHKCKVVFNIIIPLDLEKTPYFLFCSHGVHEHPPPPPTRTSESIEAELVEVVRRIRDPNLTV
jgi:hypothetical protein